MVRRFGPNPFYIIDNFFFWRTSPAQPKGLVGGDCRRPSEAFRLTRPPQFITSCLKHIVGNTFYPARNITTSRR
jgi:hypothetical protein